MEEFNGFENVMNDIEIIKEIKKLEEANNKLGENNSNETRQYENSEEGELLQELDETRDVEKRQKLIEKIKDLRQPKLDGLYMKLNDKIRQKENIVTQMKKIISADKGKITKLRKQCDALKENKENPDWEKEYNKKMERIENLSQGIEKISKELEVVSERLNDLKNKNFDKILEEEAKKQEIKQQKVEIKNAEQQEMPSVENKKEEPVKPNNNNDLKWDSRLTPEQIEELQAEGIEPGDAEYYLALANYGIRDKEGNGKVDNKTNIENKWHSRLTLEQIEELQAEGIEPGDAEYYLALANYGIKDTEQNINEEQEKEELVSDEPENIEGEEITTDEPENGEDEEIITDEPENGENEEITTDELENSEDEEITTDELENSEDEEITTDEPENSEDEEITTDELDNGEGYAEKIDTVIINEDKIETSVGKNKIELFISEQTEQEQQLYDSLSDVTRQRIDALINNDTMNLDLPVVLGLLANEKQLNDYLSLCELYKYIGIDTPEAKAAIEQFNNTQEVPEITYNLKGIRKLDLDLDTKLERYNRAKETKKMFKKMGLEDKIDIKIGILDRMYLSVRNLFKGLNSKKALPATREGYEEEYEEEYVEPGDDGILVEWNRALEVEDDKVTDYTVTTPEEVVIPEEFFTAPEDSQNTQEAEDLTEDLTDEEVAEIMKLIRKDKDKEDQSFRGRVAGYVIDHEQAIANAEQNNEEPVQKTELEQGE